MKSDANQNCRIPKTLIWMDPRFLETVFRSPKKKIIMASLDGGRRLGNTDSPFEGPHPRRTRRDARGRRCPRFGAASGRVCHVFLFFFQRLAPTRAHAAETRSESGWFAPNRTVSVETDRIGRRPKRTEMVEIGRNRDNRTTGRGNRTARRSGWRKEGCWLCWRRSDVGFVWSMMGLGNRTVGDERVRVLSILWVCDRRVGIWCNGLGKRMVRLGRWRREASRLYL